MITGNPQPRYGRNMIFFATRATRPNLVEERTMSLILMTYVAHDAFLAEGGRLGFVITQFVFKTVGGGEGFRSFEYESDGTKWYLPPLSVHDLSDFQPFEGASNRTAVLIVGKEKRAFSYPVSYTVWKKMVRGKIASELQLHEVREATARTILAAQPIKTQLRTSSWLTARKQVLPGIQKVIGTSDYKAYEGVNTGGLNGCFWIRVVEKLPNGELLIENLHDAGRFKVEPGTSCYRTRPSLPTASRPRRPTLAS